MSQFCQYLEILGLSSFQRFKEEEFGLLLYDKELAEEKNEERLEQLRILRNKLRLLEIELRAELKANNSKIEEFLNINNPQFGYIKEDCECLWFAYDYKSQGKGRYTNLNFFLVPQGFYIDVNAELSSSFRRFLKNLTTNQELFNSLIKQCLRKSIDLEVALWTKMPLKPEIANRFHWLQCGESIKPKGCNVAEIILNKAKEIQMNFLEITENMKADCINKRGEDSIKWYLEHYEKKQKRRNPMSSCVLRIRHLIKKEELIEMNKDELLKRIVKVSMEFLPLVEFANKEN